MNTIKQYLKMMLGSPFSLSTIKKSLNWYLRRKNVVMLHTGRCGSTVVGNMLNAHSKVFWAGEIFERFMRSERNDHSEDLMRETIALSRNSQISEIYGFEIKYLPQQHLSHRCLNLSIEECISSLRALGFDYFVVLHRKNYLRRAISAQVGRVGGKWHSGEKVVSATTIKIDIESFSTGVRKEPLVELFSCMDENYEFLKRNIPRDCLFLTYEDDILDDPRLAYKKLCEFLELEVEAPEIDLHRTNPFPYEQIVSNFEEIEEVLKGTKYAWMLNE